MQLSIELIDWVEAVTRNNAGTLHNDLVEINDGFEPSSWVRSPAQWPSDSSIQYTSVQVACNDIKANLPNDNQEHFRNSIGILFNLDGLSFELPNPMECWFMALAPITVQCVAQNFDSIDFETIRELFKQHCTSESPHKLFDDNADYENDFHSYLIQWKQAVDECSMRKWGILAHCG